MLTPADSLAGTVEVVVRNASGTSESTAVQMQSALPGFFRLAQEYVVATNAVGGYFGPTNLVDGLLTIPAKLLDTIVLWGTGFGPTDPAGSTGALQTTPTIRFGNRQAQVNFAGAVPIQRGGAGCGQRRLPGGGFGGGRADVERRADPGAEIRPSPRAGEDLALSATTSF